MQNNLENDYQSLRTAAVTLATKMMATLNDEQLSHLERCTRAGASIVLEMKMPGCTEVALRMREIEGGSSTLLNLRLEPRTLDTTSLV